MRELEAPYPFASPKMKKLLRKSGIKEVTISAEVGDGWLSLIETTIQGLQIYGWDGKVDQIKEKFGGLRFYIQASGTEDQINKQFGLIDAAERQSFKICERCGSTDEVSTDANVRGFWLKSWCLKCRKKEAKDYENEIKKRLKERGSK